MDELIKKIVPAAIDAVQWADWEKWAEKSLEEFAAEIIKLADAERAHCQGCDELAAQVEVMREALIAWDRCAMSEPGVSMCSRLTDEALALPNTAADILRQRDARVLRNAAEHLTASVEAYNVVRCLERELENGKCS